MRVVFCKTLPSRIEPRTLCTAQWRFYRPTADTNQHLASHSTNVISLPLSLFIARFRPSGTAMRSMRWSLSCDNLCASTKFIPVQSVMLSIHLLGGLPLYVPDEINYAKYQLDRFRGFGAPWPKIAISHWLEVSPLQQCTHLTCYTVILLLETSVVPFCA